MKGGLAAGLLFVLPGAAVVLALAMLYGAFGNLPVIAALFYGVKAAVLAIVIEALLRVARRALKTKGDWILAGLAFAALFVFEQPFPLVIIAAALFGFWRKSRGTEAAPPLPPLSAMARTIAVWGAIWLVPLAAF